MAENALKIPKKKSIKNKIYLKISPNTDPV